MSDFPLLHSSSRITLTEQPSEIRETFLADRCADHEIQYDPDSLTGIWQGRMLALRYEWTIKEQQNGNSIVYQRVKSPLALIKRQFSLMWPWAIVFALLYYVQYTGGIVIEMVSILELLLAAGIVFIGITFIGFQGLRTTDFSRYPDPLIDGLQEGGYEYRRNNVVRIFSVLWYVSIGLLIVAAIFNNPIITLIFGASYLTIAFVLLGLFYLDGGTRLTSLVDHTFLQSLELSGVAQRYGKFVIELTGVFAILYVLTAVGRLFVVHYIHSNSGMSLITQIESGAPYGVAIFDQLVAAILLISGFTVVRNVSDEEYLLGAFDFNQRSVTHVGRLVDLGAVLFSSILIYIALGNLIERFLDIHIHLLPNPWISLPTTTFIASLFALYFPLGILYQHRQRRHRIEDLMQHSTPEAISVGSYSANVRIYDSNSLYATSFSTWNDSYIVISEGYRSLLTDRELAAVVAHEEGHIENGDTRLCNFIAVLSTVLLIGRNVLYALVDFQCREERADQYAREQVDDQWLMNALIKISQATDDEPTESFGVGFTPHFDLASSSDTPLQAFQLFFGEFALNDHPTYGERLQRIYEKRQEQD